MPQFAALEDPSAKEQVRNHWADVSAAPRKGDPAGNADMAYFGLWYPWNVWKFGGGMASPILTKREKYGVFGLVSCACHQKIACSIIPLLGP